MQSSEQTRTGQPGTRYAIAAILALAVALRLMYLRAQDFYIDEAFNFLMARHGLADILYGSASESNPPLPALLAHVWILVAGREIVALRMMSVCMSTGAVWLVFLTGRRMAGGKAALAAAALAAVSPYQLFYSHVFRYPALAILIGALAVHLYSEIVFGKRRCMAAPFAFVCAAALYTHYYFVFLLLFFNVHYLLFARKQCVVRLPMWIASQVLVAACFAPWLKLFSSQGAKELAPLPVPQVVAHLKEVPYKGIINVSQSFISGAYPVEDNVAALVLAVLSLGLAASCIVLAKEKKRQRVFSAAAFLVVFITPYTMMLFLGLRILPMYFCFFSPLFYVIAVQALALEGPKVLRGAAAACFIVLLGVSLPYYVKNVSSQRNNENTIRYIVDHSRPGDVVVVNPTYQASMFQYFAPGKLSLFGIPRGFDVLNYNFNDFTQVSTKRLAELDAAARHGSGRVWCFNGFGDVTKPDSNARTVTFLKKNYRLEQERHFRPGSFSDVIGRMYLFTAK